MKRKTFVLLVAVAYALLFAYTGIYKFIDMDSFKDQLEDIPVFYSAAWIVPAVELLLTVCLLFPVLRLRALVSSVTLMGVFTIYLIYRFWRPYLGCACGGFIENLSPAVHLFFNLGVIALGILAIRQNNCMQTPPAGGKQAKPKTCINLE